MMKAIMLAAAIIAAGGTSASAAEHFSVEVRGKGPDVILVPGLGSSRATYERIAPQLEGRYRLHLVQIAGFAGEPAGANASSEDILGPVTAELSAYARTLKRPAYIGHSIGGLLGQMIAAQPDAPIGKLMIVDSLPFFSLILDRNATVAAMTPYAARSRDQLIAMPEPMFHLQQEAGAVRFAKSAEDRALIVDWGMKSDRTVFARAMYQAMTTDMRSGVGEIKIPTTIVYAYDPVMGAPPIIDDLYAGTYAPVANKKLVRIDNAMHFVMFDQKDAFAKAVEDFLR